MAAPGEHILSAADVDAMGGQSAVMAFRQALHSGNRRPIVTTPTTTHATSSPTEPLTIENHIEIGGEVVRVVRTEITEHDRGVRRRVLAGSTR